MQLKSGTLLQGGKYRIDRVLGQGGFGITYEADQVKLRRKVAVKEFFMKEHCNRDSDTSQVSVPSVGSQELVSRFMDKFLKEARVIASLSHPRIVKIYDVFEENGTAYYVMEYLAGGSLSDKCYRKALPETEALDYIRQVGSALTYLHTLPEPLNHLDVKPSNILLDKDGQAVLVDFGISKRYDNAGSQTSSTPVGVSHGFSPLEQYIDGGVKVFSPAVDVYSLGATLYNLVTGSRPPHASEVLMKGLPELPSTLSSTTRTAIVSALQPRGVDRPQQITDFLALLGDPGPVSVSPDVTEIPEPEVRKIDDAGGQTIISGSSTNESDAENLPMNSKWVKIALIIVSVASWVIGLILAVIFYINKRRALAKTCLISSLVGLAVLLLLFIIQEL